MSFKQLKQLKQLKLVCCIPMLLGLAACDKINESITGGGSSYEPDTSQTEQADQQATNEVVLVSSDDPATEVAAAEDPSGPAAAEASQVEVASAPGAVAPEPVAAASLEPRGEFHLLIDQTHMACGACGLYFDSGELVINHSSGRYTADQQGSLLIKKGPYRQGSFRADTRSIPPEADIYDATLYMRLNKHEGIAGVDHSSEYVVKGYVDGRLVHVMDIHAQRDIKGRGYSKGSNPVVPFDVTDYARRL